jgi:hypothetical protein
MGNVQSIEYLSRELKIDEDVLLAIVTSWEHSWTIMKQMAKKNMRKDK